MGTGTGWAGWARAHPGNNLGWNCPPWISLFGNSLNENCPPWILCKNSTVLWYYAILVLHLVIWVGNDARLPTQNTKFRVGIAPISFLPALFIKRAGAPGTDVPLGVLLFDINLQVCGEVTAWLSHRSHAGRPQTFLMFDEFVYIHWLYLNFKSCPAFLFSRNFNAPYELWQWHLLRCSTKGLYIT